jgi:hypothetical protein
MAAGGIVFERHAQERNDLDVAKAC